MAFKIGFTAVHESAQTNKTSYEASTATIIPRKSVVQVAFPGRGQPLAYYNDRFDLHCGDIVYVDGKLEGQRGRVVEVCYNFKIKVSDYHRIIAVADPRVQGSFLLAGDHFITFDRNTLPYEQAILWFKAPDKEDEEIISGNDDSSFPLRDLSRMGVDSVIGERGQRYYLENRVKYLRLDGTHGRAIVTGSKSYEIEFTYEDGQIRDLVCNCFCCYPCKHEVAAMLQLRETLDKIEKYYAKDFEKVGHFTIIHRETLFDIAVRGREDQLAEQKFEFTFGRN